MQYAKVHPVNMQEDIHNGRMDEHNGFWKEDLDIQDKGEAVKYWEQVSRHAEMSRNSSIKCLQDILEEPQSDNISAVDFCFSDFEDTHIEVCDCSVDITIRLNFIDL